jgi:hypothetical protein
MRLDRRFEGRLSLELLLEQNSDVYFSVTTASCATATEFSKACEAALMAPDPNPKWGGKAGQLNLRAADQALAQRDDSRGRSASRTVRRPYLVKE